LNEKVKWNGEAYFFDWGFLNSNYDKSKFFKCESLVSNYGFTHLDSIDQQIKYETCYTDTKNYVNSDQSKLCHTYQGLTEYNFLKSYDYIVLWFNKTSIKVDWNFTNSYIRNYLILYNKIYIQTWVKLDIYSSGSYWSHILKKYKTSLIFLSVYVWFSDKVGGKNILLGFVNFYFFLKDKHFSIFKCLNLILNNKFKLVWFKSNFIKHSCLRMIEMRNKISKLIG
jgi:hypothetical protein